MSKTNTSKAKSSSSAARATRANSNRAAHGKNRRAKAEPLRGGIGADVVLPTDPKAYRAFEAAVLAAVPGRKFDSTTTEAQRRYQIRFWAGHDANRRTINTTFQFWKVCGHATCARAKSCTGDPHACLLTLWPHVDPEFKAWLRAFVPARVDGASVAEALKAGEASIAAYRSAAEYEERLRTGCKPPAAEPVAVPDAPLPEHVTARVRLL